MKNKNYDTIEPVLKFTRKIVETGDKINASNTQIHDLAWYGYL